MISVVIIILVSGSVVGNIIHMNSECDVVADVLLDCTKVNSKPMKGQYFTSRLRTNKS